MTDRRCVKIARIGPSHGDHRGSRGHGHRTISGFDQMGGYADIIAKEFGRLFPEPRQSPAADPSWRSKRGDPSFQNGTSSLLSGFPASVT